MKLKTSFKSIFVLHEVEKKPLNKQSINLSITAKDFMLGAMFALNIFRLILSFLALFLKRS